MSRFWVHILLPFLFVSLTYDTSYLSVLLCTLFLLAVTGFIRRKNIFITIHYLLFSLIALLICNNAYSVTNKSFYPLVDKPVTLTCAVDDTPVYSGGTVSYTAKMISAMSGNSDFALDGKILLNYEIENTENIPSYADVIKFKTKLHIPEKSGNYRRYLNSIGVFVSCDTEEFAIVNNGKYEKANPILYGIFSARDAFIKKCDMFFNSDTSSFIKALLLGYKTDFSENIQSDITRSGISHIVSVSGMHLSVLVYLITFLIRRLKINLKFKFFAIPLLNIVCALFITALTGFSPSVKRAALMMVFANTASLLYRENDSLQSLSFAVVVLLISNPCAVYDIRLVLSALAVAGIVIYSPSIERALEKFIKIPVIRETCSISIASQIFTLPVIVYSFNTLSLLGILTNLIIVPAIPYIMGAGFVFLIIPVRYAADFISGGIWLSVQLIFKIIHIISSIPFCQVKVGFSQFAFVSVLSAASIWFIKRTIYCKSNIKNFVYFISSCVMVFTIFFNPAPFEFSISAIDTGRGDCSLIRFYDGKTMIIDCGSYPDGAGTQSAKRYLAKEGISKIDYAVISSPGIENTENILLLAESMKIGCIIIPDCITLKNAKTIDSVLSQCEEKSIPVYLMNSGDSFSPCKECKVQILYPLENTHYKNSNSPLVLKINAANRSVLFTGSIKSFERQVLSESTDICADILKLPSGDSFTWADENFTDAVNPDFAYIFSQNINEKTAKLYSDKDITLFPVLSNGTVKFTINRNGEIRIE